MVTESAGQEGKNAGRALTLPVRAFGECLRRNRLDLVILVLLTVAAAVPRVVLLGDIPPGLHGDEAQFGMEARRILEEGSVGPYTRAAVGTPAGTFYWVAALFWTFDDSVFFLRLAYALLGIATVPVAYLAFKSMFGRPAALIGTLLLATMAWHIHFSRVAHVPIALVLTEVAMMWALFEGIRRESPLLFGLAGAAFAASIYTYGAFPTLMLAVLAFIAFLGVSRYRRRPLLFTSHLSAFLGVAVLVSVPMIGFTLNDDYWLDRYEDRSVTSLPEYEAKDSLLEKAWYLADRELDYLNEMIVDSKPDHVDAAGIFPFLDWLIVPLIVGGLLMSLSKWKSPPHAFLVIAIVLLTLSAAFATEGHHRRTIALTPLIAAAAALPLALFWEKAREWGRDFRPGAALLIAAFIGAVALLDIGRYFQAYDDDPYVKRTYAVEMVAASYYLNGLPADTYVYFLSDRWSFGHDTRRFLAPDYAGEDRSLRFGPSQGQREPDLSMDGTHSRVVWLVLSPYESNLEKLRAKYPGGETVYGGNALRPDFIAYYLPREIE